MASLESKHNFLEGGGEMGKLIRARDWSKTPLGNPKTWPQTLHIAVRIVLDSPYDTMISLEPSESKKLKKQVEKFLKYNTSDLLTVQEMAQNLSINPGNTIDSVAQEILKNISEIANLNLDVNVKNAGLIPSLNRLLAYKTINYYNVRRMAKALKMKKESKTLKKIKSKNQAIARKFKSLTSKKIFEKAQI